MKIKLKINNADADLIRRYALKHNMSISKFIITTVLDRIEDEYDLKAYEEAIAEHNANPITHNFDEIMSEIGVEDE